MSCGHDIVAIHNPWVGFIPFRVQFIIYISLDYWKSGSLEAWKPHSGKEGQKC